MARIDRLFDQLVTLKGSDLHLSVGYPPLARVRGDLVAMRDALISKDEIEALLFEITNSTQKQSITQELDFDFAYVYENKARFRANYFYKSTGLAAVFRIILTNVLSLTDLQCPEV